MKLTAVLFDLDGTLVNSLPDITTSLNYVGRKLDFPELSTEEVKKFVGDGVRMLISRTFPISQADRRQALDAMLDMPDKLTGFR